MWALLLKSKLYKPPWLISFLPSPCISSSLIIPIDPIYKSIHFLSSSLHVHCFHLIQTITIYLDYCRCLFLLVTPAAYPWPSHENSHFKSCVRIMFVLCLKPSDGFKSYLKHKSQLYPGLQDPMCCHPCIPLWQVQCCHSSQDISATVAFHLLKYAKFIPSQSLCTCSFFCLGWSFRTFLHDDFLLIKEKTNNYCFSFFILAKIKEW